MSDYEDLQKRCQRGATNLNDANNLLAECYGMLGKLGADLDSANKHWENESNNVQALTAEVIRLKAENEALRNQVQSMIDQTTPLVPVPGEPGWSRRITIDELQAEVEALRTDAERYRWLCDGNGYFMEEEMLCGHSNDKAEADKRIDRAMSKEG